MITVVIVIRSLLMISEKPPKFTLYEDDDDDDKRDCDITPSDVPQTTRSSSRTCPSSPTMDKMFATQKPPVKPSRKPSSMDLVAKKKSKSQGKPCGGQQSSLTMWYSPQANVDRKTVTRGDRKTISTVASMESTLRTSPSQTGQSNIKKPLDSSARSQTDNHSATVTSDVNPCSELSSSRSMPVMEGQSKQVVKNKSKCQAAPQKSGDIFKGAAPGDFGKQSPCPKHSKTDKIKMPRRSRSEFATDVQFKAYIEEEDARLARKLQEDFNMEAKFRLNAIRRKGSDDEYRLRTKKPRLGQSASRGTIAKSKSSFSLWSGKES